MSFYKESNLIPQLECLKEKIGHSGSFGAQYIVSSLHECLRAIDIGITELSLWDTTMVIQSHPFSFKPVNFFIQIVITHFDNIKFCEWLKRTLFGFF